MNHYEKASKILSDMSLSKVTEFAKWYLGEESYGYSDGMANRNLEANCSRALRDEAKAYGDESLEMYRVWAVLDYVANS